MEVFVDFFILSCVAFIAIMINWKKSTYGNRKRRKRDYNSDHFSVGDDDNDYDDDNNDDCGGDSGDSCGGDD